MVADIAVSRHPDSLRHLQHACSSQIAPAAEIDTAGGNIYAAIDRQIAVSSDITDADVTCIDIESVQLGR